MIPAKEGFGHKTVKEEVFITLRELNLTLSKELQDRLVAILEDEDVNIPNVIINPFDHVLSEEEAFDEVLNFSAASFDDDKKEKYLERESTFKRFLSNLFDQCDVCIALSKDEFQGFEEKAEFENICQKNLREETKFNTFVIDENVVLGANFDLSWTLFALDGIESETYKAIQKIAVESGLFCIN